MSTELVFILSLLMEGALLGLITASTYRAWAISARTSTAQLGRELYLFMLTTFTGVVLWWDLFNPGKFPIEVREWFTFPAFAIGIAAYVAIAMDIEGKYRGIETIRHEIAKYKQRVQSLEDLLGISEEDKKTLEISNEGLRQRLEKRERNATSSSLMMAQLHAQSVQIAELSGRLNQVGVSADNAYNEANHAKKKLEDLREEGLESNKEIAEKQKKKDDNTDAKLDSIEKTGSENLSVTKDINTKLKVPQK